MSTQTPIQVLLALGLHDAEVARRLRVSPVTICYWRTLRRRPSKRHQDTAVAFLSELQTKISLAILSAAFSG